MLITLEKHEKWEWVLMESVAFAYNEHEQMSYHWPTLPLLILKHQVNLHKKELAPNLKFDMEWNPMVNNLQQEIVNSIVADQPQWWAWWIRQ